MTNEERVFRLEQQIRNFNAVVSGAGLQGGFHHLDGRGSLEARVAKIRAAHVAFAVHGGDIATVEGNLRTGLAINFRCPPAAPSGDVTVPSGGGPPPPPTGACCDGIDCTVTTASGCLGTYQGDGTTCSPNPCTGCSHCGFRPFGGTGGICSPNGCLRINCDGSYSNPAPSPNLYYLTATCTECDTGIQHISTVDPTTCLVGGCGGCPPGSSGCNNCICPECYNPPYCGPFSVQLSTPVNNCDLGACCHGVSPNLGLCDITTNDECNALGPPSVWFAGGDCSLCGGACCPNGDCFNCPGCTSGVVGSDCISAGGCWRGYHSGC